MHTYVRRDDVVAPSIGSVTFRSAQDVVDFACVDRTIGWKTWPEVWHLDGDGTFVCYYNGSSLCSIQEWAHDPWPLERSREEGLRTGACPDTWLIVDSRPTWQDKGAVGAVDAAAFVVVRHHLRALGVELLDALVFDDQCHWWSLRELSDGQPWLKATHAKSIS